MFSSSTYLSALVFEAFKVTAVRPLSLRCDIQRNGGWSGKKVKIRHPTVPGRRQKAKSSRCKAKSGHRDKNWSWQAAASSSSSFSTSSTIIESFHHPISMYAATNSKNERQLTSRSCVNFGSLKPTSDLANCSNSVVSTVSTRSFNSSSLNLSARDHLKFALIFVFNIRILKSSHALSVSHILGSHHEGEGRPCVEKLLKGEISFLCLALTPRRG